MKNTIKKITLVVLGLTLMIPTLSHAGFGLPGVGGGAAGGGGGEVPDFLKQLTPGAVKFAQAYAKYYEALGDSENAAKLKAAADQMATGGTVKKGDSAVLDKARKNISELSQKSDISTTESKAKWKEANKLYASGLLEWGAISATVALAIKNDPKAVMTNPALGAAAAMCVKGIKDLSGFIDIAYAKVGETKEQGKADH